MRRNRIGQFLRRGAAAFIATGAFAVAGSASADSCRDWTQEHWALKADVVRLYLRGAAQEDLDAAVFELLQREAYMTSCDARAQVDRAHQVGWRMVDRSPDEYAAIVIEGLLADAGLELTLAGIFAPEELATRAASVAARSATASR